MYPIVGMKKDVGGPIDGWTPVFLSDARRPTTLSFNATWLLICWVKYFLSHLRIYYGVVMVSQQHWQTILWWHIFHIRHIGKLVMEDWRRHEAGIRLTYAWYSTNRRLIYGWHTADIRLTYARWTAEKLKSWSPYKMQLWYPYNYDNNVYNDKRGVSFLPYIRLWGELRF